MNFEQYTYTIADCWLPAIINGDFGGLDDAEVDQVQSFMEGVTEEHGFGHWSYDPEEQVGFAVDEISNLHADCLTLTYNAQEN